MIDSINEKIQSKKASITVIGLGVIGLPTALMFANAGYKVNGYDVSEARIQNIQNKKIVFNEVALDGILNKIVNTDNFKISQKIMSADIFIIAVPTPLKNNKADMSYIEIAVKNIVPKLQKGNIIILESTVPPKTCSEFIPKIIFEEAGLVAEQDYYLVHCPERVIPGEIYNEIINNDRIIGVNSKKIGKCILNLYNSFVKGDIWLSSSDISEITKLMENTYRDVNIALANQFKLLCDDLNIDSDEAVRLANKHPRVNIHQNSIGVGGYCIPVAPWFLNQKSKNDMEIIVVSRKINNFMPTYKADKIEKSFNQLNLDKNKHKIGIIGLTYKPDTADFRFSPAIAVARELQKRGFIVNVYDPYIVDTSDAELKGLNIVNNIDIKKCDYIEELVTHKKKEVEIDSENKILL